ncbi:O-methyltransferase [Streptomyces luteolus]|uniref:Class I SAM-dependent methyltransferase n=1 Tax=Streptomyces luteolus TaxID=3043615 RepID=A0ABT6SPT6_9ACTN|nr:class I SAM-dependent methyltransferase [Streptomyces sp. B-S-A12]MDI3417617.1 class I SAM-dependent methyltransferase [Streptomyces sp. B-S-A12]
MDSHLHVDGALLEYLRAHSLRDTSVLATLRRENRRLPCGSMQVSPEQGQLLALLVRISGARRVLEVGCFTGYSALCMASALPADGCLVTIDQSETWTRTARRFWQRAGVSHRIDLRLGDATRILSELVDEQRGEPVPPFDLVFIDADKTNYPHYYQCALELVGEGGLIVLDNVLWSGRVSDPAHTDPETTALRSLNALVHQDERVDTVILPIGDGMTLARKRPAERPLARSDQRDEVPG